MSWRDDPEIIWQDSAGDRIEHRKAFLSGPVLQVREGSDHRAVWTPKSLDERVEATDRWLAALGLTADNIRELPRPIAEGDIVTGRISTGHVLYRVLHIDGDDAMVRDVAGGRALSAPLKDLRHAEPEPEPEWVVTRDPRVLAAAIEAGRIVQYEAVGGWFDATRVTADECRQRRAPFGEDLRYEGPAIEAPVDRCTPDNRTCEHDEPWCAEELSGFLRSGSEANWWCSRPPGHDGPHIPCSAAGDVYGVDVHHNLHLRPEDR